MRSNMVKIITTAAVLAASMSVMAGAEEVKQIKVGMMGSIAPYCYLDDDDNLVGFDVDMIAELDERMENYTFTCENLQYLICTNN